MSRPELIVQQQCCNSKVTARVPYLNDATLDSCAIAVRAEPEASLWHMLTQAGGVETMSTAITQQKIVLRLSKIAHLALQSVCKAKPCGLC